MKKHFKAVFLGEKATIFFLEKKVTLKILSKINKAVKENDSNSKEDIEIINDVLKEYKNSCIGNEIIELSSSKFVLRYEDGKYLQENFNKYRWNYACMKDDQITFIESL